MTGAPQWFGRVTLPGGRRRFVALDPSIPHEDEARARAGAMRVSALARGERAVDSRDSRNATRVRSAMASLPRRARVDLGRR